jgi:Glyoxalase-like domain
MTYSLQIAVDATNPHAQADWWAETLGWSVEPSDGQFIRSMIDQGHASEDDTLLHRGQLVWRTGAAICPTDQLGTRPRQRILFQVVPEPKTVKNRVHWDIDLRPAAANGATTAAPDAAESKETVRDRLLSRGATFLWEARQGPHSWFTMADPEGNEFCIS